MKGPLVRATLEGRKTQTRRLVKCGCNHLHEGGNPVKLFGDWSLSVAPHQYDGVEHLYGWRGKRPKIGDWIETVQTDVDDCFTSFVPCPLGRAGDRLWVRETFAIVHGCRDPETGYIDDWMVPRDIPKDNSGGFWAALHRANDRFEESQEDRGFSWRPAIHMPRWACRLVLPLVSVRVERVQDITEEDARAEGIRRTENGWTDGATGYDVTNARAAFQELWASIYGQESWDANPWVWVAEWKEIEVSK